MIFWMVLKVAVKSLLANRLRSILAMLGIIMGVAAVIAMISIGAGTQKAVLDQFSLMGTNLLVVRPASSGTGGVNTGTQQTLTVDDAMAIIQQTKGIKSVSPVVGGNAQVKFMNRNNRTNVQGVAITYMAIRNTEVAVGEMFTEADVDRASRVAVIGPATAENLFGADDPINQNFKVNGINFRVVGMLKAKGDQGFFNPDDQILIPYTTAMRQVFGSTGPIAGAVREIDILGEENTDLTAVQEEVTQLLRKRHRLQAGRPDDFSIRNQAEFIEARISAARTMTFLLGAGAAISLLVGGIGIMNIMLVTVTERTREIGIRKAIGARDKDILVQFLIEAILMSGLGGILGATVGISASEIVGKFSSLQTIVKPVSIAIALGFSGLVGVFFGFYPATRAASLDPIECLRYE